MADKLTVTCSAMSNNMTESTKKRRLEHEPDEALEPKRKFGNLSSHRRGSIIKVPKLTLTTPKEIHMNEAALIDLRNAHPRVNGMICDRGLTVPLPTGFRELQIILFRGPKRGQSIPKTPVLKPRKENDLANIPELRDLMEVKGAPESKSIRAKLIEANLLVLQFSLLSLDENNWPFREGR